MFLITAVQDLEINEDELEEPFLLMDGVFLAWTPSFVQKLIPDSMKPMIGGLEYLSLTDGERPVLFSQTEGDERTDRPLAVLSTWNQEILHFLHCLWLIKDNSLRTDVGFVKSTNSQGEGIFSSNYKTVSIVCADGCRRRVRYSRSELVECWKIYSTLMHPTRSIYAGGHFPTLGATDEVGPRGRVVAVSAVPALIRATFFVSAARDCSDLPTKVAHYVTCLEVLFSNDPTELSHKLAERIALFLGDTFENRKNLFKLVKKLYTVRSTVVHGDTFRPNQITNLADISRSADDLVRRALRRIMEDPKHRSLFEGSKETREEYFINLVLQ